MRILAFSDLHLSPSQAQELVTASREADLVVGAGDFCNMRRGLTEAMTLLDDIQAPILVVPGNAESSDELIEAALPNMTVLHGTGCEVGGLRFFGLGGAVPETPFGDWSFDLSEVQAEQLMANCNTADVLILHSPPKEFGDKTSAGLSIGSQALKEAIERVAPRLAVFGHVHDSWGYRGKIGNTVCANLGPKPNWFEL